MKRYEIKEPHFIYQAQVEIHEVKTFINKENTINPIMLIEFMTPFSDVHKEN